MKGFALHDYRRRMIYPLIGAAVGYLAAHPITVFVYMFLHQYEREILQSQWDISRDLALSTYQPWMLPMALSLLLAGGFLGLLLAIAADRRRKLHEQEQRRTVALETLHQLMITLSHYLLNANTVIGGTVRRIKKRIELDGEVMDSLSVVEDQAKKVDSVVHALQKLTEVKTSAYIAQSPTLMIDIAKEIEEQLKKTKEPQTELRKS